jgi:ribose transport system permease protein
MTASVDEKRARVDGSTRVTDLKYRYPARYQISWIAFFLLGLTFAVVVPDTFQGISIRLITALGGVLIVATLGQMLVIMIGAIDLSVPAMITLSAGLVVHYSAAGNLLVAVLVALVACPLISTVNGILISVLRLNAVIVTLAMNGILTGGILLWTGQSFSASGASNAALQTFTQSAVLNVSAIFVFAVVAAVILTAVLNRTRVGRQVAAVGSNRDAARILGMRVHAVEISVFTAAGLLYSTAGILLAGFVGTMDPSIGEPYALATITAAAVGGVILTGGPASTSAIIVACLLLGALDQGLAILDLGGGARLLVQGVILILAVSAITSGQLAKEAIERLISILGRPRNRV